MKILLTEDVKKLGKKGEIVDVSDGYAKNFILPKKLGIEANKAVLNEWQVKKGSEENRKRKEEEEAKALAKELTGKEVVIRTKAGDGGRLFGSITSKDVAEAAEKQLGLKVDKKKIQMPDAIKGVGEYTVTIKLHAKAAAEIRLKVENDG
ncbi:MAG: 50S ribosomal protein L9 [Lachnospiraceae bacterium]|jgi:large subunit ribosomal protein L9|nr:50S ribosomal protein L9 [Lachnospiraceae bacterium]